MKKYFNEKHESIVNVRLVPKESNPIDGKITPHVQIANDVTFFQITEDGRYYKVWMSRDQILDIAAQINKIESETIDCQFENGLPF